MKTCVSIDCPLISYCKHYSLNVDRSQGCETQKRIVRAAQKLTQQKGGKKK